MAKTKGMGKELLEEIIGVYGLAKVNRQFNALRFNVECYAGERIYCKPVLQPGSFEQRQSSQSYQNHRGGTS